ncbi:STAS domain-containing protein [Streptacidiphilus sp. EB129]|uniref:STAS domain-containing protein n=1 Tax=Streptacidiphilus sp. EB129 TaxID=3156262 RepID=UPI0035161566
MGESVTVVVLVPEGGSMAQLLLSGDLDLDASAVLRPAVTRILSDPAVRRIEIDVALVSFCDSSGLGALVEAYRQAAGLGVPLHLTQVGSLLGKVLTAAGLRRLLST